MSEAIRVRDALADEEHVEGGREHGGEVDEDVGDENNVGRVAKCRLGPLNVGAAECFPRRVNEVEMSAFPIPL